LKNCDDVYNNRWLEVNMTTKEAWIGAVAINDTGWSWSWKKHEHQQLLAMG
jgi:hypothetical protein